MKHIYKYLLTASFVLIFSISAQAQEKQTNYGLYIGDIALQKIENRLEVDFTITINGVKIRPNQALRVTPYVTNGEEMIQLPAVVIDGRRRHIVHLRDSRKMANTADTYIRHHNRKAQVVEYESDVEFESWMADSELYLREEWISCHDRPLDDAIIPVAGLSVPRPISPTEAAAATAAAEPYLAYLMPQKPKSDSIASFDILFPVNRSTINSSFMSNSHTIEQMQNAIKQSDIKQIHLMGYASPEGPYEFNKKLAAKRAEAIKTHLQKCNLPADVDIVCDSAPTNWEALKKMLNKSYIENYLGILAIIDNADIKPEHKNATIKQKYPTEYDFMLRTWYPKLRTADITIDCSPAAKSSEQIKEQLKQDSTSLSLEDLYIIALTYEKGSKEWDEIILLAVENYPLSYEARINAANVAIADGEYTLAAQYLEGVPSNIPQAINSRGILAMAQGDFLQAQTLFEKAESAGLKEATANLSLLKKLMAAAN